MTGVVAALAAASGFKATASPVDPSGFGFQTELVTVTVFGGAAPYTHQWIKVSGDDLFPQSPTSRFTRFFGTVPSAETFFAEFYDLVTDANGQTTVSNTVSASITGG